MVVRQGLLWWPSSQIEIVSAYAKDTKSNTGGQIPVEVVIFDVFSGCPYGDLPKLWKIVEQDVEEGVSGAAVADDEGSGLERRWWCAFAIINTKPS